MEEMPAVMYSSPYLHKQKQDLDRLGPHPMSRAIP